MTRVRSARPDDLDPALALWSASLAATGARPSLEHRAQLRQRLAAGLLVVAASDGEVVGAALGEPDAAEPDLVRLVLLAVHPAHRRRGLGAALAEGLADAAWGSGARRLSARPPNAVARTFLLACGLAPEGPDAGDLVGELEPPARDVVVHADGLRLGQLLKLAGLAPTGAQATALLSGGGVEVNDEPESRRGRQLRLGDVVRAGEVTMRLVPPA